MLGQLIVRAVARTIAGADMLPERTSNSFGIHSILSRTSQQLSRVLLFQSLMHELSHAIHKRGSLSVVLTFNKSELLLPM